MNIKRWIIKEKDEQISNMLQKETELSAIVCDVLVSKGITTVAATKDFIEEYTYFESPFILKDMEQAVERIHQAIAKEESIVIYGDYDCDGITSTALLMNYLQSIGGNVSYYIPARENEGYGLNNTAIDTLKKQGTQLIVTVDNGISSHNEVDYAASLGIDTVITDHHTPRETLPNAVAVVNPHRKDCPSAFKELAGVGVAFKLVCALEDAEVEEMLDHYSDLVAIGTVADVVPLISENRGIVRHGLANLSQTFRPGIIALLEKAGISTETPLTSSNIAFGIAPRLNAAGRVGNVADAVELLTTEDEERAAELADKMAQLNLERRSIEEKILIEVEMAIANEPERLKKRILFVSGKDWHPGVMGIVASRLLEQYGKPCFVFSQHGEEVRGSSRSLDGFDIIEAIHACSEKLLHYGGHAMAAGATLLAEDLEAFDNQIQAFAAQHYDIMPVPTIVAATSLDGQQLTVDTMKALDILGPFGAANEMPLFAFENMTIKGLFPTKEGTHMRVRLGAGGREVTAIYFRMGETAFPYIVGELVDAIVEIDISVWNEVPQLSVRIIDLRQAGFPQEEMIQANECYQRHCRREYGARCKKEELIPDRKQFALVYRYLREQGNFSYGVNALYEKLQKAPIDYARMCIVLDSLEELGLIKREQDTIEVVENPPIVDLENAPTLQLLRV